MDSALVVGLTCLCGLQYHGWPAGALSNQKLAPAVSHHLKLIAGGMDSALVVGLTCRVGCSTRADQQVLSAARSSLLQSANTWG
ncbi:unnamed protein product [Staurois parvus]|uniref:Uncharacterized protein n=1 Tax=Staurois parvus TaxID=386267 RepID=A0ABN9EMN1_9NEOB|nr:unnamed protein product [Staurois parvus]